MAKIKTQEYKIAYFPAIVAGFQRFLFVSQDGLAIQAVGVPDRVREFPDKSLITLPIEGAIDSLIGKGFTDVQKMPAVKGWNRLGQAPIRVLREMWPAPVKGKKKAA